MLVSGRPGRWTSAKKESQGPIGRELFQFGGGKFVVVGLGIAQLTFGQGGFSESRSQCSYRLRFGGGFFGGIASELKHFRDVRNVVGAELFGALVIARVVIAVGHAQSALIGVADHFGAVGEVLRGTEVEERLDALVMESGDFREQALRSFMASMASSSGAMGLMPADSMALASMQVA